MGRRYLLEITEGSIQLLPFRPILPRALIAALAGGGAQESHAVMFNLLIDWMPFLLLFVPLFVAGALMGLAAVTSRWRPGAYVALVCGLAGLLFLAAGAHSLEVRTDKAAPVITDRQQRALFVRREHQRLAEGLAPGLLFAAAAIAPAIVALRRTRKGRSQASQ